MDFAEHHSVCESLIDIDRDKSSPDVRLAMTLVLIDKYINRYCFSFGVVTMLQSICKAATSIIELRKNPMERYNIHKCMVHVQGIKVSLDT